MKIGAHVSAAGGLSKSIDRAKHIGAEAIQIFASSPRAWAFKYPQEGEVVAFREKSCESNISAVFLHASYLVNVGGSPDIVEKSVKNLSMQMEVASQIGAEGVVFHGGSHKGVGFEGVLPQAVRALSDVLDSSPSDVWLIIENSAGMGSHIGSSFGEIGALISAIGSPQVKVCLDTQHCFAAGYNIVTDQGVQSMVDEFDREIGISQLVVVHANDSKMKLGSGVDRHENIGEGYLQRSGFAAIMRNPAFREIPFVLEVPGFDSNGPDKENVDRLKSIRSQGDM